MLALVICDDRKTVRYFHVGFPGSSHDQRVMSNPLFYQSIESYFDADEYIVGDSAYTPHERIVPCFKKPPRGALSCEHEALNNRIAKRRIAVEHCIGIMKGFVNVGFIHPYGYVY